MIAEITIYNKKDNTVHSEVVEIQKDGTVINRKVCEGSQETVTCKNCLKFYKLLKKYVIGL